MAYAFDAKTSTRFVLTGTIGNDAIDLSDNIIQGTEVDPVLPQDVDLLDRLLPPHQDHRR